MNPPWSPSDELLSRFLCAECTSDEARAVHGWLAVSPDHARRLEALRRLFSPVSGEAWNVDRMWAKVRTDTVDASRPAAAPLRQAPRVAFAMRSWRAPIAASIVIALIGSVILLERTRVPAPNSAAEDVVYQTRRGQSATVQLSDGSKVRLAPESRLVIAGTFGDSLRELTLEGEAEFDVHHDAAHPFRVRTATTVTEDIGTRFAVRAYRNEAKVTVAVAEGSVALARRAAAPTRMERPQGVLLGVGELGTLDAKGTVAVARGAAVTRALAWTKGDLVFANQPLAEVLATIARWYDLDIEVKNAAVAVHVVTAEFSTQSPDEMLQALAIAVEATVARNGRHVTLRGR